MAQAPDWYIDKTSSILESPLPDDLEDWIQAKAKQNKSLFGNNGYLAKFANDEKITFRDFITPEIQYHRRLADELERLLKNFEPVIERN